MPATHANPLNFDLRIDNHDNGYRALIIHSPAGEASHYFALPFSQRELATLLELPNHHYRHMRLATQSEPETKPLDPLSFGTRLFKAVFAEEIYTILVRSINEARRQESHLHIRLRLKDVPELAILPWEYLFNPERAQFLVLSADVALMRYMEQPEAIQSLEVTLPLRVLCMLSDPDNALRLAVEQEWVRLQEALQDLVTAGKLVLERLPAATSKSLQRHLRQGEYHIFHFIGHGWFDESTETSGLIFENENGKGVKINARQLGVLLEGHRPLRLAFLNACEGARALSGTAFSGTAQHLARQNLPAIIAMQFLITDENAVCLSHEFYKTLADSWPIDRALTEARKAVYVDGNSTEWATPVLFMRAENCQLFNIVPDDQNPFDKVVSAIYERSHTKAKNLLNQLAGADVPYFRVINLLRMEYPFQRATRQIEEIIPLIQSAISLDNLQAHYYYLYAWIKHDYLIHHPNSSFEWKYSVDWLLTKAKTREYKSKEMEILYKLVPGIKEWLIDKVDSNNV